MLSGSFTRCTVNMRKGHKTQRWVGLFMLARKEHRKKFEEDNKYLISSEEMKNPGRSQGQSI